MEEGLRSRIEDKIFTIKGMKEDDESERRIQNSGVGIQEED